MAQGQFLSSMQQVAYGHAVDDDDVGTLEVFGDIVGFVMSDESYGTGANKVLRLCGQQYTDQFHQAPNGEALYGGQALYYDPLANKLTGRETDWPVGWAERAKDAADEGTTVSLMLPRRRTGVVLSLFDMTTNLALGAIGSVTLRDFGAGNDKLVTRVVIVHDAALNPNNTTISIGDGTGANNQIMAATDVTTLEADQEFVAPSLLAVVDKIVLSVGVAALTAGFFRVYIEYADL